MVSFSRYAAAIKTVSEMKPRSVLKLEKVVKSTRCMLFPAFSPRSVNNYFFQDYLIFK